ncbi:MAG: glycogen synthase [Myxococcota bacterium]
MNIAVVSAEVAPWSKTGGLGDVCGALPTALARLGHRVCTISPRYKEYPDARDTGVRAFAWLFGALHEVRYFHLERDGVHHLFVDHPSFARPGIYGDTHGQYGDNLFRYALLARAALEAVSRVPLGDRPLGEDCVLHVNDWHTSLVPLYVEALYRPAGRFQRAGTVLGIHNAGHQGTFSGHDFGGLDVPGRWWPAVDFNGNINVLKTGVGLARKLVAVSPNYAREVCEDLGFGLEGMFRSRRGDLLGILNGVDDAWDPATDKHLAAHFTADDLSGKATCKAALQRELGLPVRPEVPMFSLVARLDHQKGIDLVAEAAPWLMQHDVQLVMLGSGSSTLEQFFRDAERWWPKKARGWVGFNEGLAHRIEAGADVFLMPSRFEPCGLNQMYSMRYGTVPIVHAVGGLADTVQTVNPEADTGTGWAFRNFSVESLVEAMGWALLTYTKFPEAWRRIQLRGMRQDFSWERSAKEYVKVYEWACG